MKKPSKEAELKNTQIEELTSDLQRLRADFENYRKRVDLEKSQARAYGRYEAIKNLLPVIDTVSLAVKSHPELDPVKKTLEKSLQDLNLQEIEIIINETEFNPDLHEAISAEDLGGEREVISEILRPGYKLNEEILRPALVKVQKI